MAKSQEITKRSEDFSKWYLDVIVAADLAENSQVRGSMIIKPNGYAIWEMIQKNLDQMIKNIGVRNAYFPLLIPESFLKREKEHIEGFAPELAVVTHGGGEKLAEPLVVRPTSETIMYDAYSRWIESYRNLPLKINQWANIVRWELRTKPFLRTAEFLWQEGHCVFETHEEELKHTIMIAKDVYKKFAEEFLAIPILSGRKSEKEKFAGAKDTYCIEALMQDGKSLQMGTSHDLADNFSKESAFNISFLDRDGKLKHPFQNSWGVSTRIIGGLIMIHSDDKGLVLPPKIAPVQIIIIPIAKDKADEAFRKAAKIAKELSGESRVEIDENIDERFGERIYKWEKEGIPVRIEIGPKDLEQNQAVVTRRDTGEKSPVKIDDLENNLLKTLDEIQKNLFERAAKARDEKNHIVDSWEEFEKAVEEGGYIYSFWCEDGNCEQEIKEKTKATTRFLPFDGTDEAGDHSCINCGKPSKSSKRWAFCKSY